MGRSWLRDEKIKGDLCEWWRSWGSTGLASDTLVTKLKDLRFHLFNLRRQIRAARTQAMDVALTRVWALDVVEDLRPLKDEEKREKKACQYKVAEVDFRIEMD